MFKNLRERIAKCNNTMEKKLEQAEEELAVVQNHYDKMMSGDVEALELEKQKAIKALLSNN